MLIKFLNFFLIILFYQSPLYSKSKTLNDFNSKYLSKPLIKEHDTYLQRYIYTLVLEGNVQLATNEIKKNLTDDNSKFFEAHLLLALDSLKKKKYKLSRSYLEQSYKFINNDKVPLVIAETIKQYLYIFEESKAPKTKKNFGDFSLINEAFQRCYINDKSTKAYFNTIVNNKKNEDYSRYKFFYINYLIENHNYDEAKKITNNLDYLTSSTLVSQGKKWIEDEKFKEFKKIFSCKNSNDIVGELFFLVANLYSAGEDYTRSNFYLNIANYLNPKFRFNLSLLAENYYLNKDYSKTLKILESFKKEDNFYYWFKVKTEAQIISHQETPKASIDFINLKFKQIKNPSTKIIFDIANFNKNAEKYKEAIKHYNQIISKIDINSELYAEILFRRGGCYERLANYKNSDKDLIRSLEINPDDAHVLNYLAYSWLEREHKVDTALKMLEKAYKIRSNDPYIIDSIGWAYYLVEDYVKAEKFLQRAVELMPEDPIVNDHYGDILWKLDRKIQAKYFWKSVINFKETEDEMIEVIRNKLFEGLKKS